MCTFFGSQNFLILDFIHRFWKLLLKFQFKLQQHLHFVFTCYQKLHGEMQKKIKVRNKKKNVTIEQYGTVSLARWSFEMHKACQSNYIPGNIYLNYFTFLSRNRWVEARQNQQNDMCALQRLESAWALRVAKDLDLQTNSEAVAKANRSHDMTKPTKWLCAQRKLRSSAQSDQSLRCPHEESLDLKLPIGRTAKTLFRLGGCPGWSESSLGA